MKQKEKDILIVGLGKSGRSLVDHFLSLKVPGQEGVSLAVFDDKIRDKQMFLSLFKEKNQEEVLSQIDCSLLGATSPFDLSSYALIITSPGIPPHHPLLHQAMMEGKEVIGDVEYVARVLSLIPADYPCIGVTGTNGKSTAVSLISHIANLGGVKNALLGNIGHPLVHALDDPPSTLLVVELSSAQLSTCHTPFCDVGVITSLTPDHQGWHGSMEAYVQAKCQIVECIKPGGELYVEEEVAKTYGKLLPKEYERFSDIPSLMKQVMGQFCAEEVIERGIRTFSPLPHRLEWVETVEGVEFYDDSKATNVASVIHAVRSLHRTIYLIVGGVDKGGGYEEWIPHFLGKVERVLAIGEAAKKIESGLKNGIKVDILETLEQAFKKALSLAKRGDIVLLSPGCSSFDQFSGYEERGEAFKRLVLSLKGTRDKKTTHIEKKRSYHG